ncbi:MAG: hypothetical protein AAGA48_26035 [Myxococcota bacterium]
MSTPPDLDSPDASDLAATEAGTPARRSAIGATIIAPFDEMSDAGPEPIRVARMSPVPAPTPDADAETQHRIVVHQDQLPTQGLRQVPGKAKRNLLAEIPRWAWIAAAVAMFMLASLGFTLIGVAIALYIAFA